MVTEPVGAERGERGGYALPLIFTTVNCGMLPLAAFKVLALITPVLIKLVLRNPVLIGSKELLIMPPFAILMPPFTLMVDAFRVEGITGVPEGGG
jgi:hypothetical protein